MPIIEDQYRLIPLSREVLISIDFHWWTLTFHDRHWCQCHKLDPALIEIDWNWSLIQRNGHLNFAAWFGEKPQILTNVSILMWSFLSNNHTAKSFGVKRRSSAQVPRQKWPHQDWYVCKDLGHIWRISPNHTAKFKRPFLHWFLSWEPWQMSGICNWFLKMLKWLKYLDHCPFLHF